VTPPTAISSSLILTVAQMARFLAEVSAIEEVSFYTWAMVGLSPEKTYPSLKNGKGAQGLLRYCFLNADTIFACAGLPNFEKPAT
jgi:hypothetical protein